MQTRNVVLIVVSIVALCFVLLVLGGMRVFKNSVSAQEHSQKTASLFLHHLASHEYADSLAMLSPEAQKSTSLNDLKDVQELLEKRYGTSTGEASLVGWHLNDYNGVSTAEMSFQERFSRQGVRVNLSLKRTDQGWLILNYSPQLGASM